jgi:hypothetical protein
MPTEYGAFIRESVPYLTQRYGGDSSSPAFYRASFFGVARSSSFSVVASALFRRAFALMNSPKAACPNEPLGASS